MAEPTYEEVTSLKNNKATGPDNMPAELLKMAGEELTNALYKIVLQIWNEETLPAEWLEGAIIPLHKKGDKMLCENYRGIALLNSACKVFAFVLFARLQPRSVTVIGEYQGGFRRNRSTTDKPSSASAKRQRISYPSFHRLQTSVRQDKTYGTLCGDEGAGL